MKVGFNYEIDFLLENEEKYSDWICRVISESLKEVGELNYIFCGDEYLHKVNLDYLGHDTYTDIITFDYVEGKMISGDIFISIERVSDNSKGYSVSFDNELRRVMIHGVLHLLGYKDKTEEEKISMRREEDRAIKMFHVKQ